MNSNPTQAEVILRNLRSFPGVWLAMPVLARKSGAYAVHSRVAELRRRGHNIECRVENGPDHSKRSFYRLKEAA